MKNPELKDIKAAYGVADENGKKMLRALYPRCVHNRNHRQPPRHCAYQDL